MVTVNYKEPKEVTKPILNLDLSTLLKTVPFTKVSGLEICGTVTVYRSGPMVLSMKVAGDGIKQMEKGSFGMLMVMFLMGNGKRTKLMALVLILMSMGLGMRVSGSMTYNMDKDVKYGRLGAVTKELMLRDRSMVEANISGKTIAAMRVNGTGTKLADTASIYGRTDECT